MGLINRTVSDLLFRCIWIHIVVVWRCRQQFDDTSARRNDELCPVISASIEFSSVRRVQTAPFRPVKYIHDYETSLFVFNAQFLLHFSNVFLRFIDYYIFNLKVGWTCLQISDAQIYNESSNQYGKRACNDYFRFFLCCVINILFKREHLYIAACQPCAYHVPRFCDIRPRVR